jgi:hypothetical protein
VLRLFFRRLELSCQTGARPVALMLQPAGTRSSSSLIFVLGVGQRITRVGSRLVACVDLASSTSRTFSSSDFTYPVLILGSSSHAQPRFALADFLISCSP